MKKNKPLESITLHDFRFRTESENFPNLMVNDSLGMVMHGGKLSKDFMQEGQVYHMAEGRIIMIVEGSIETTLDLEEQFWQKGDIVLLAPDTIQEVKRRTHDFDMIAIAFKNDIPVEDSLLIQSSAAEWKEMLQLMHLTWSLAIHEPFRQKTVMSHIATIINNIQELFLTKQQQPSLYKPTNGELLFRNFKKLVNEHCGCHRNIPFYAEKLYITPHHLSAVIKRQSGKSVMYWINRAVILKAKVLLSSSEMRTNEIADRLNFPYHSTFTNFFKRETGISPLEYKNRC